GPLRARAQAGPRRGAAWNPLARGLRASALPGRAQLGVPRSLLRRCRAAGGVPRARGASPPRCSATAQPVLEGHSPRARSHVPGVFAGHLRAVAVAHDRRAPPRGSAEAAPPALRLLNRWTACREGRENCRMTYEYEYVLHVEIP